MKKEGKILDSSDNQKGTNVNLPHTSARKTEVQPIINGVNLQNTLSHDSQIARTIPPLINTTFYPILKNAIAILKYIGILTPQSCHAYFNVKLLSPPH